MDTLTTELLAAVCNLLPWKDRLRTRRLSSKFYSLPCDPIKIHALNVQQMSKKKIMFSIRFDLEKEELRVIKISEKSKIKGIAVSQFKVDDVGMLVHITTIDCPLSIFYRCIQSHMAVFFSYFFSFECLHLRYLGSRNLCKLLKTLDKQDRKIDWNRRAIYFYTDNRILTEEEIKFLNHCENPYKLTLLPPADFQTPDEMMNTTAIRSAKILDLIVGNENDVLETDCYGTANIDIGIDDSFLRKMIDDKKMAFHSNAKSKVTPEFLMNYITSCLNGGFAMYTLTVHHEFDNEEIERMLQFLLDSEFEENNPDEPLYMLALKREKKEGYHPDQLTVHLLAYAIVILADYSCYRGKTSIYD